MADYYLLEDGSGHYQLEDGSGSYLLEQQPEPEEVFAGIRISLGQPCILPWAVLAIMEAMAR